MFHSPITKLQLLPPVGQRNANLHFWSEFTFIWFPLKKFGYHLVSSLPPALVSRGHQYWLHVKAFLSQSAASISDIWCFLQVGEDVPDARKCSCASHVATIADFFQVGTASSLRLLPRLAGPQSAASRCAHFSQWFSIYFITFWEKNKTLGLESVSL